MSEENLHQQETQHAFLVAWGWFAQHIGLIQAIHNVPLHQKTYKHSPHTISHKLRFFGVVSRAFLSGFAGQKYQTA